MVPPRARRPLLIALVLACAAAGAWGGLRIAGPASYRTQLGEVRLSVGVVAPAHRGIEVYVPLADWGLRARVTGAPVRFAAEPRRIDRSGLVQTVTAGDEQPLRTLRGQLSDALTAAAVRAGLLIVAGALLGGLLAALLWHALGVRGRVLAAAPVIALVAAAATCAGLAAWTARSWDAKRLERPEYYASGTELERLLDQADQLRRSGERYSDQVDVAIRSIAGLLDDENPRDSQSRLRVLLASDVHNNLLTLPAMRRYAAGHPVVLAGDFTINGSRLESRLLRGLERLGRPVVAVSGNHDSPGLMRQLERRGVQVLAHGRVQEVAGLTMAGFEDPLAYAGRDFPDGVRAALSFGDFDDGHERYLRAVEERWRWWQQLPERPEVLIVHQEAIGRALAQLIWAADPEGAPLAILVGHTHDQRLDRLGPVTVVNSGSAGAGGIFGAGTDEVGLALLDFAPAGRLDATDLVQMNPSTTAARARRVITERPDCDDQLVFCQDAPKPPRFASARPSGATGPTGP